MINWFLKHWKVVIPISIVIIIITIWISLTSEHWRSALILKYFDSWSIALSAAMMFLLALAAFWAIVENRRIRVEEKERESKRRRLEEVQRWIYEVVRIKTESTSPTGTDLEWRKRNTDAKVLASKKTYFENEATRLDSEFKTDNRDEQLVNIIGRVSFIFEQQSSGHSLSNEGIQAELDEKCKIFLKRLSNIRGIGKF